MSARIRIVIIEGDMDSLQETARALSEAGIWDSTLAGTEALPKQLLAPPERDIVLNAPADIDQAYIERQRPERDWKQRERQRPKRRKGR